MGNNKNGEVVHISGMNDTPASDRAVIGFFGRRNVGKSSVVNAVTGQQLAVVSDVKGTTTDPVQKAMELLPLGPVVIIDTPGIDDTGSLGESRVRQTRKVLNKADIAVLVMEAASPATGAEPQPGTPPVIAAAEPQSKTRHAASPCVTPAEPQPGTPPVIAAAEPQSKTRHAAPPCVTPAEQELLALFKAKKIPYIIAWNKSDLATAAPPPPQAAQNEISVSALTGNGIPELKELIARLVRPEEMKRQLVGDIVSAGDFVVLVVPIDSAAPKGRLILPQQQVIRDVLESDAAAVVVKEHELKDTLRDLGKKPRIVITDSQAFERVSADTPPDVPLTSFSIIFARYKGDLAQSTDGVRALDDIKDGDRILICEGCTHHRQCDDIGTVKLPRWIRAYTGAEPSFEFTSGGDFPDGIAGYKLIVHCGACMLNEREMKYRLAQAEDSEVPITNYGMLIAKVHGILDRALAPFR